MWRPSRCSRKARIAGVVIRTSPTVSSRTQSTSSCWSHDGSSRIPHRDVRIAPAQTSASLANAFGAESPGKRFPADVPRRFPRHRGQRMNVLGVNAVFHDPAAALVIDGVTVAAAEEERFTRRKHGKSPVPFSTWELPEQAIDFCLRTAGIEAADLDAVGYSYDPALAQPCTDDLTADAWEGL